MVPVFFVLTLKVAWVSIPFQTMGVGPLSSWCSSFWFRIFVVCRRAALTCRKNRFWPAQSTRLLPSLTQRDAGLCAGTITISTHWTVPCRMRPYEGLFDENCSTLRTPCVLCSQIHIFLWSLRQSLLKIEFHLLLSRNIRDITPEAIILKHWDFITFPLSESDRERLWIRWSLTTTTWSPSSAISAPRPWREVDLKVIRDVHWFSRMETVV